MAKEIYEWNLTAALNNFLVADGGMPEGQSRKSVNNSTRERMRAMRQMYDDDMEFGRLMRDPADGTPMTTSKLSDTVIRVVSGTNDMSAYFPAGRRLQSLTSDVESAVHHVDSVSYSNPNTDVTITQDTGDVVVPAGIDEVRLHHHSSLGRGAFLDEVPSDYVVPTDNTDAAFVQALAAVSSGGTLLLRKDGPTIVTQQHSVFSGVTILGNGPLSGLQVDAGADIESVLLINGKSTSNILLQGFRIEGERATQTGGTGDGIKITNGVSEIMVRDVFIRSTRRHGIYLHNSSGSNDVNNVSIEGFTSVDTGGDGISSIDPFNDMHGIRVDGALINTPGQEQAESAGIHAAGEWNINNVSVDGLDLGGGNTQRGIWLTESLDAGNGQHAERCAVTNFTISGTGGNARGVEVDGVDCAVGNGVIDLTGGTSRGVFIGGSLGFQAPTRNSVDNVVVRRANIGALIQSTGFRNTVTIRAQDCATGVRVEGDANYLDACVVDNATVGYFFQGDDNRAVGCAARDCTDDLALDGQDNIVRSFEGFDASADGATFTLNSVGNKIYNSSFLNVTGTAVDVESGASGSVIDHVATGGSGTAFADAGTRTIADDVEGVPFEVYHRWDNGSEFALDTVSHTTGVGLVPDGTRKYRLTAAAEWHGDPGSGIRTIELRSGVGTGAAVLRNLQYSDSSGFATNVPTTDEDTPVTGATITVYNEKNPLACDGYVHSARVRGT